jgi:hypothetical protein
MKHGYQRFNQYPKGSTLWLHIRCYDEVVSEQELLKKFDERYQRNNEFGREYFIGDVHDMMEVILQYVGHTCNLSSMVEEHSRQLASMTQEHSKQIELFQEKLNNQTACLIKLENEKLLLQKELERVTSQIEDDMIKLTPPASVNGSLNCAMNIDNETNQDEMDQENGSSSSNEEGAFRAFNCSKCKKMLSSKWSLERHTKTCKQVPSNECPICHKVFSSRDVRNKHMKNVKCSPLEKCDAYKKSSLSNYCENCNKQLSDKRAYIRHLKICKGHDSKTCPTCKKQFNSYQARWKHMKNVKCTPPTSSSNASIPILNF